MMHADALPALRIRSCRTKHAGAFARLHTSLFAAAWDAASFRDLLSEPSTLAFAAEVGADRTDQPQALWGLIVGRVVADEAEILTFGVARERQRLGVGRRLVERLCRAAGRRGARRLYLEVAEGNGAARALYARLGFNEDGRRPGYYEHAGAPPEDGISLSLTLAELPTGRDGGRRKGPHL